MLERRLLYLTQHQMLAFRWQNGALSPEGEFIAEDAGEGFTTYLKDHARSLFTMVVNLGEEGFHPDVIPFLQSGDRSTVIARRLGQSFLGAPLAVAVSHGYQSGARKNEKLLLTALTSISQLAPWLDAIRGAESRLQGVYSLPLLSENLIARLGLKIGRGMLVTVQDNSVRESFFNDGRLQFSRVAPLSGSSISDVAQSIASEANRFQQYLLSQRMVSRGERLDAYVLAHAHSLQAIQAARFNDGINVTLHDVVIAAKKIGLKTLPADNRAHALFLHCAIASPPRLQFASTAMRHTYRLWQLGNALRAVGALVLVASLLFSVKLVVDAGRDNNDARRLIQEAEGMEQNYQQALGRLPPISMSNDTLRQLVERVDQLGRTVDSPEKALHHLSLALDATPEIEIESLDWLAPGAGQEGQVPSPASAPATAKQEALLVKGSLNAGQQGSARNIVKTFDDFQQRLRTAAPTAMVSVLQSPVDLNASRALKSADGAATVRTPRRFEIRIEYPSQP